jgi:hypothetical protein
MRKLLLTLAASAALASPAFAEVMLKAPASDVVHASTGSKIVVPVGAVVLIGIGNSVHVFVPGSNVEIPALAVVTDLAIIADMVFTAPSLLTVQGGSYGQVIDYSTSPPTKKPYFPL